jgi:hypothetical protein
MNLNGSEETRLLSYLQRPEAHLLRCISFNSKTETTSVSHGLFFLGPDPMDCHKVALALEVPMVGPMVALALEVPKAVPMGDLVLEVPKVDPMGDLALEAPKVGPMDGLALVVGPRKRSFA